MNANADEIIKRQIALANYNKTNEDFYKPERNLFLNKFYEYCRANGDSFNTKWSNWEKTIIPDNCISSNKATSFSEKAVTVFLTEACFI